MMLKTDSIDRQILLVQEMFDPRFIWPNINRRPIIPLELSSRIDPLSFSGTNPMISSQLSLYNHPTFLI